MASRSGKRVRANVHVVPILVTSVRFVLKDAGSARVVSRPAPLAESISAAIRRAKRRGSQVVIHRRDGRFAIGTNQR